MNGAVYISFFQGQLESVLEQVVQLAVQEISKTVGASLNSMLMETAAKEQENQRLSSKLQSREYERKGVENGSVSNRGKSDNAAADRTKPESHTPNTNPTSVSADTRRLEQKGRVVGQLKTVMEQVLDFAVCELTKIVEASFDDLLLEVTLKEREQQDLEERLRREERRPENGKSRAAARRRCSERDSSPSGSEGAREEPGVDDDDDVTAAKIMRRDEATETRNDSGKPASVLSVAQDWVPILDKVFGQKWCSDLWQIKELPSMGRDQEGLGLGSGSTGLLRTEDLRPSPTSPQQDPQWMPLEDMEVLSLTPEPQPAPGPAPRPAPTPSVGESPLRSPSMLHRLLTLPAQLLEDDEDADAMEPQPALAEAPPPGGAHATAESPGRSSASPPEKREGEEEDEEEEEDEGEEEDEEEKGTKVRNVKGRKSHECKECGRKFGRARLLKAHRLTHAVGSAATPELRCSECGKRFSQGSRLQAHARTHAGKKN